MFIRNAFSCTWHTSIPFHSLKDQFFTHLTPLQKKVAAVALLLLSYTALLYIAYHYCFKTRKIEEEVDDLILNFDNLRNNQDDLHSQKKSKKIQLSTETPVYPSLISQVDYLDYKHALADIRVIYQCDKKGELNRLEEVQGRLQKKVKEVEDKAFSRIDWQNSMVLESDLNLRKRLKIINDVHAKLHIGQDEPTAAEYILAADEYNTCLKVMQAWNQMWETHASKTDFCICSPLDPKETNLQQMKVEAPLTEDEKALNRYVELLEQYPQLKRVGENNDHKQGMYEIVYNEDEIRIIQARSYKKFYDKLGSYELAAQASRPGLVFEDAFWLILRDCVITPNGTTLTYNRLVQKSQLNECVGAAVMPIITLPNGETKISLVLHYRHATQSWEFELPRGSSEPGETPEQTAQRELCEETGYEVEKPLYLGTFPPDSGAMSSLVPVFSGKVIIEKEGELDETEAIKGKFLFSYDEIMQALKSEDSCLEVMIDGEKKRYPVRDPFLYCALLLNNL